MLDERRKNFVTASQAHRVMAGFEIELAGKSMVRPDFESVDAVEKYIIRKGKPKVSDLKCEVIVATGKEIDAIYKYVKATTPTFSEGMWSVAREIAMYDFLEERDEQFMSKDMERGNQQEGDAVLALSDHIGVEFDNTTDEQVFFHKGALGVTPDAVEYDGFDVVSCGEVKNPKDITHMKYLAGLHNQKDMLKICPEYYWQAQAGLSVTGASCYHWASYHNGFLSEYRLVYVCISPVESHIEILKDRAERVVAAASDISTKIKKLCQK